MAKGKSKPARRIVPFSEIAQRSFDAGAPRERVVEKVSRPLKMRYTPVMWGIPCDELSFSKFWRHFVPNANLMPWDGYDMPEGTYLEKARNSIHEGFKNKSNLPLLVMLDSDVMFPPDFLERLTGHGLPKLAVVGGWYRDKNAEDHHPCVYDFVEDQDGIAVFRHRKEPGAGLERVDAMGAGCWIMTREVAEAVGDEPYSKNIAGGGEDFKFCRRLMELNIPLYVDWSINCAHLGVGLY
jgi:hypothetical protein